MIVKITGNKKYFFPDSIDVEERLVKVNKMLEDELSFDGRSMTVEEYFRETWDKDNTRTNLEKISFYLSKMPEQNGRHDKEVLSRNDELEMNKGVRWKTVKNERVIIKSRYSLFTYLDKKDQVNIGLVDSEIDT